MLSIQNLEVVYQDVILVLRGISFEIPKGKIVALLGSNGSGKTTVIRSITGLLDIQNGDITKGSITLDGEDITNLNPSKIVEKGIAQVMEGRRIFSELSVAENLRLGGHTNSANIQNNIDRVLEMFPALKDRQKGEAGYLSGGEQQMLAIGRALMSKPKVLLLDECFAALDVLTIKMLQEIIVNLQNESKITICICDHQARDLLACVDVAMILSNGKIIAQDTPSNLVKNINAKNE